VVARRSGDAGVLAGEVKALNMAGSRSVKFVKDAQS
jgi:hypothetical protein